MVHSTFGLHFGALLHGSLDLGRIVGDSQWSACTRGASSRRSSCSPSSAGLTGSPEERQKSH